MTNPRIAEVLIALLVVSLLPFQRLFAQSACSTEKVNGNCQVSIDRNYPITLPTIQMRPGTKVSVVLINPLPFETVTLDPQSAQGVVGTEQFANFLTTASPNLKAIVAVTEERSKRGGFSLFPLPPEPNDTPELKTVKDDLNDLTNNLKAGYTALDGQKSNLDSFAKNATFIYLQLQEILSPLPRPTYETGTHVKMPIRHSELESTVSPWDDYPQWRSVLLCELAAACDGVNTMPTFMGLLTEAIGLLSVLPAIGSSQPTKVVPGINDLIFDTSAFTDKAIKTAKDIDKLPEAQKTEYRGRLKPLVDSQNQLSTDLSNYATAISVIAKDLQTYFVNIRQTEGAASRTQSVQLGEIHDPRFSSSQNATGARLLGRQVVFSVNAVNNVASPPTVVVPIAQKKSIDTITVLYADPIFEVSTGVFFSTLPDRSFANQTVVTQNPGGVPPTQGNVVITQTITRPTVEPFVAANWRIGHDFLWLGGRRGAMYVTTAVGINTNAATTADFAFGPSISWRSVMLSPLYHLGRDTRLTQGEFVGQIWCNASQASDSIPKCSGPPPSPSTEKFWTSAFAFGISVRIPSVFK